MAMMKRNEILLYLVISSLVATAFSEPQRKQDDDVKEVETNAEAVQDETIEADANTDDGIDITKAPEHNDSEKDSEHEEFGKPGLHGKQLLSSGDANPDTYCWLPVPAKEHFDTMDALDEKYHQVRQAFHDAIMERHLNEEMLAMMLQTRAAAERAIHNAGGMPSLVPAGINLGGYGMMKLSDSILFFHRMKLRNETRFKVNYLNADVYAMVMTARLNLNDLLLYGSYDRAISENEALFYRPTFGELQLLLKSVTYKMEGRLRLVQNRLVVEHVISELHMKDVMLMYNTNGSYECQKYEQLSPSSIVDFLERLKADLDSWLKDYFNDYLLYFQLSDATATKELHYYDKQKQSNLNDFIDQVVRKMHLKLYSLTPSAANVKTPSFSIFTINQVQIKLFDGVIRGIDSFYRNSVATGRVEDTLRMADAVIGFSRLRVEYKYEVVIGASAPMRGLIVLIADDLIVHLGLTMIKEPVAVDLAIGFLRQKRSQMLVIEGPLNRKVGNFKHVMEHEIITLLTNTLYYQIKKLSTLSSCEPSLEGHESDEHATSHNDAAIDKGKDLKQADYAVKRNDSIELEVPGDGKRKPKRMHISYSQNFALHESELPGGPHFDNDNSSIDGIEVVHNEGKAEEEKTLRQKKAPRKVTRKALRRQGRKKKYVLRNSQ